MTDEREQEILSRLERGARLSILRDDIDPLLKTNLNALLTIIDQKREEIEDVIRWARGRSTGASVEELYGLADQLEALLVKHKERA